MTLDDFVQVAIAICFVGMAVAVIRESFRK
jgi:hypothetical protein